MKTDKDINISAGTATLRRRAEDQLNATTLETPISLINIESERNFHELQVHQIELEMQNSELRTARDEAETSLNKYTDLYDFAPVSYFTLDHAGFIKAVNFSGAELLGEQRAQLINRRFVQFIPESDRSSFTTFISAVLSSKVKQLCESKLQCKQNRKFTVQIEAIADSSGQGCRIALIDITERKQIEVALRESEEKYRSIFDQSLDAVILKTPDGNILEANPAASRMFGLSVQELLSVGRDAIMDLSDPRLSPALEERNRTGRAFAELRCTRKDGSHFPVELSSVISSKNSRHTFVIIHDISQRKKTELELFEERQRVANNTLQEKVHEERRINQLRLVEMEMEKKHLHEKEMLVKDLHDGIGGLLTKISMLAQYAKSENTFTSYDEIMGKILGFAYEGAAEVRSFMNSLEDDKPAWGDLLAEITEHSERMLEHNDSVLSISSTVAPDAPLAGIFRYVNIVRILREAVANIVRHASARNVHITFTVSQSYFTLSVHDNGVGYDATSVRKRGVANMYSRARLLGSDLSVESFPGNGTIVRLSIPIGEAEMVKQCV
jgi:PAS domain S-box-containing protein